MTFQLTRIEPRRVKEALQGQTGDLESARETVEPVLRDVAERGDAALREYTEKFDDVTLNQIRVTDEEIRDAYDAVDDSLVEALEEAAASIGAFHTDQLPPELSLTEYLPGIHLGQKITPLDSVGCYVPGGKAAYPSSALMTVIPARVAGVRSVTVCTPPPVAPETLVAAHLAGADAIYRVGGSQAIAALAHGTDTVEPVDKIVGPGGVFVTAAKALVRGTVEIDFLAGPSEVLIVADTSAEPDRVALDMAAQAEHGPDSVSILVTTSEDLVDAVEKRLGELLEESSRGDMLKKSLDRSFAVTVDTVEQAVDLSNDVAPEHLEILVRDELAALNRVRNAGAIFVGPDSPVAAGDYATGANHVLPTAGTARRHSGLDTMHFLKRSTVQRLDRNGLESLAPTAKRIGEAEGLEMHVRSIQERLEQDD